MHNSSIQLEIKGYSLLNKRTESSHVITGNKNYHHPMKTYQNDNLSHSTLNAKQKGFVVKQQKLNTPGRESLMKVTTTTAGSNNIQKGQVNEIQAKNDQLVNRPKQQQQQIFVHNQENKIKNNELPVDSSPRCLGCCFGNKKKAPNEPVRHVPLELNFNAKSDEREQKTILLVELICFYTKKLAEQDYQKKWTQIQLTKLLQELKQSQYILERHYNHDHMTIIMNFKYELVKYFYYHKKLSSALLPLEQILVKASIVDKQKYSIFNMRIFRFIILFQIALYNSTLYATMESDTNALRQEYDLIKRSKIKIKKIKQIIHLNFFWSKILLIIIALKDNDRCIIVLKQRQIMLFTLVKSYRMIFFKKLEIPLRNI